MGSDFISLNRWDRPGFLYQAAGAAEVVEGGPGDWPRLRERIAHWGRAADPRTPGGAAGFFRYDGSFWFGIYPRFEEVPAGRESLLWAERRRAAGPCGTPRPAWRSALSRARFEAMVCAAQELIRRGDIYQVNLSRRCETTFAGNAYRLFEHLLERSPAPGAAFVDTGATQVLSASPELFLAVAGGRAVTRPIKGTRPRGGDPARDRALARELTADPKEAAELVMITDLARNDLGQICEYGSVEVSALLSLEPFAQVFHLVSTVEGRLRRGIDAVAAVAACFPGGSITGAPKRRAMEVIAELETVPRGLYTGAIGWLGFGGDAAFGMAIRTLVREGKRLHFHTGSGITADSDPAGEYRETRHKARGLRLALAAYAAEARDSARNRPAEGI